MFLKTWEKEKLLEMIWSLRGSTRLCLRPARAHPSKALRWVSLSLQLNTSCWILECCVCVCDVCVYVSLFRTGQSVPVFQFWTWLMPSSPTVSTLSWLEQESWQTKTNWATPSNHLSLLLWLWFYMLGISEHKNNWLVLRTHTSVSPDFSWWIITKH